MREFSSHREICIQDKSCKFPAFRAQKGTLRMQPVRRIFLCAGCFFFRLKAYLKKKQLKHLRIFARICFFCSLVFPKKSK